GFIGGLVILEKHMSGTMVIVMSSVLVLYLGGAKIRHFAILSMPAILGVIGLVAVESYRLARWETFLNPWKDKLGSGYQVVQSLLAIGSGGIFGLGLGQSRQKYLYIPEAHNDFIFSILSEELGFVGASVVIVLFLLLIWRGIKIAVNAPDTFGSLLAGGLISLIALQIIINIAVVTASMPATGMQLPFFSAGGSSMVFMLSGMGMILSVSKFSSKKNL
ncbi:MAG: FtsW/RodA/SpoVE family cell cycle protein, partial [Hyphomonadaceae bacterium]|nr:FtsW/RodA/SpoVE family cell cycle protein [Clostridia bacterium]